MASENGWEPARLDAGSADLVWITVPGTDVSLQLMKGPPSTILGAWAADWNAFIEPLRDADSAGYTPTNSVATSNHLNGTATDLNWGSHPFHVRGTLNADQMVVLREMLDFYEDTVFWAGDWDDPIDEMHSQMGYGSWNNPHTQDFINRKIRADGFSAFRRADQPPAPPPLSRADQYAIAIIEEGRRRQITPRGIKIALSVALVETNMKMEANSAVPDSLNYPHDAVGSDHDSIGLFQQRSPMWGAPQCLMDPACSAGLFYDRLAAMDYNDESRSPGSFAADIQRPAVQYRGRYDERFGEASQLYDRLAGTPQPPQQGDDMANVPQEEWNAVRNAVLGNSGSRSALRWLDETRNGTGNIRDLLGAVDGNVHVQLVKTLAALGDPLSLAVLEEVANADLSRYPSRAPDKDLANAILADIYSAPTPADPAPPRAQPLVAPSPPPAPVVVYQPPPAPVPVTPPTTPAPASTSSSTGEIIGRAYDALQELRLADALPIEDRAPLAALISVLQTKNGSEL